jgi:zinc-finger of transposase IS204/IS1001/IS1096/IS1165
MRVTSLLRQLLSMKQTRVVGAEFGPSGLEVDVAPTTRLPTFSGCGRCRRSVYDRRSRTWRHLDFGGMEVALRSELRRVDCERCGTVAELVPWAKHDSRYTPDFEDHVAYLAQRRDPGHGVEDEEDRLADRGLHHRAGRGSLSPGGVAGRLGVTLSGLALDSEEARGRSGSGPAEWPSELEPPVSARKHPATSSSRLQRR